MNSDDLKQRTKSYGLQIIRLVETLPNIRTASIIGYQLVKCGTSVGANYRAACRAKSRADFISKLGIVEEETDESVYWMEILEDSDIKSANHLRELMQEGNEILSIIVSSINTAKRNRNFENIRPKSAIRNP